MKAHFETQDNMVDKKLLAFVKSKGFASRKGVTDVIKDIVAFFAQEFTKGSQKEASNVLNSHGTPIRKTDLMLISFFGGVFIFMLPLILFFILVPSSGGDNYYNACWVSSFPTFRMTFISV